MRSSAQELDKLIESTIEGKSNPQGAFLAISPLQDST